MTLNADGSAKSGNAVTVVGFTGRTLDVETGLWYFRARYFSDGLNRFIGRDPLTRNILNGVGYPVSGMGYYDGYSQYNSYFIPQHLDPSGRTGSYNPDPGVIGDPEAWCERQCSYIRGTSMESVGKTGNKSDSVFIDDQIVDSVTEWITVEEAKRIGVSISVIPGSPISPTINIGGKTIKLVLVKCNRYKAWQIELEEYKCTCKGSAWCPYTWFYGTYKGWREVPGSKKNEAFIKKDCVQIVEITVGTATTVSGGGKASSGPFGIGGGGVVPFSDGGAGVGNH